MEGSTAPASNRLSQMKKTVAAVDRASSPMAPIHGAAAFLFSRETMAPPSARPISYGFPMTILLAASPPVTENFPSRSRVTFARTLGIATTFRSSVKPGVLVRSPVLKIHDSPLDCGGNGQARAGWRRTSSLDRVPSFITFSGSKIGTEIAGPRSCAGRSPVFSTWVSTGLAENTRLLMVTMAPCEASNGSTSRHNCER